MTVIPANEDSEAKKHTCVGLVFTMYPYMYIEIILDGHELSLNIQPYTI